VCVCVCVVGCVTSEEWRNVIGGKYGRTLFVEIKRAPIGGEVKKCVYSER